MSFCILSCFEFSSYSFLLRLDESNSFLLRSNESVTSLDSPIRPVHDGRLPCLYVIMTSSTAIVLSSDQVKSQMNMAAGPRNGPDPRVVSVSAFAANPIE